MKRLSAVVSDEEYQRIEKLVRAGAAKSVAQLVRQAVREYAEKLGSIKLLSLREVPLNRREERSKSTSRATPERYGPTRWPKNSA